MTKFAVELSKRAMTAAECMTVEQYLQGAKEAGYNVTRENVRQVFPPDVSDLVMRYLRGV